MDRDPSIYFLVPLPTGKSSRQISLCVGIFRVTIRLIVHEITFNHGLSLQ